VFFIQWTPDMYGEGVKGIGHEPGFMVVKKPSGFETREDEPLTDINNKEWEVRTRELRCSTLHSTFCVVSYMSECCCTVVCVVVTIQ
jgi:hypothetical protein